MVKVCQHSHAAQGCRPTIDNLIQRYLFVPGFTLHANLIEDQQINPTQFPQEFLARFPVIVAGMKRTHHIGDGDNNHTASGIHQTIANGGSQMIFSGTGIPAEHEVRAAGIQFTSNGFSLTERMALAVVLYVRQDKLKDRLHREIIDRDYHLSAAMYCDIAGLDKFTWIFVNKDQVITG